MQRSVRLFAAGAAAMLLAAGAAAAAVLGTGTAQAATSGGVKFAYFTQWGIYQNAYYPKTLHDSGMADKIDFINYAFENIDPVSRTCFERTQGASQDENNPNAGDGAGDQFADYLKSYTPDISVDGVGDVFSQPLAGNFNQLKKLKARHPNLKILVSIGGWTYSKYFSDAAATDASRKAMVSSCIDMFIKGNLPAAEGRGGPGSGAGIFDGIDIDWEYPGAAGHVGNHFTAADKQNFTLLLAEFRRQLDALGGSKKWLTAAVPAGQDKILHIETNQIGQFLDFANIMTYDFHGGWEAQGPTNYQTMVFTAPNDPMTPVPPGNGKYSTDEAVKAWLNGAPAYGIPGGFPASKTTIGFALYARGWAGVPDGGKHGVYQPATGPAPGHTLSGNVPGVAFFKELSGIVTNPAFTFTDPVTKGGYYYNGNEWWAAETAASIKAKADYLHCNGLGGSMMYSLEADNGVLAAQVLNATAGSASSCTTPTGSATGSPTRSPSASPSRSPSTSPSASRSPTNSPSPSRSPGGTCTAPAWSPTVAYVGGQQVSYLGHTWTAKWWTQGDIPGNNSQGVWTDNGACGSGGPTGGTGNCAGLFAWNSTTAYTGGQSVMYNGHKWTAKWWTQGDVPGANGQNVWTDNGAC